MGYAWVTEDVIAFAQNRPIDTHADRPVGILVYSIARAFRRFHTLCVCEAEALAERSLFADAINTVILYNVCSLAL